MHGSHAVHQQPSRDARYCQTLTQLPYVHLPGPVCIWRALPPTSICVTATAVVAATALTVVGVLEENAKLDLHWVPRGNIDDLALAREGLWVVLKELLHLLPDGIKDPGRCAHIQEHLQGPQWCMTAHVLSDTPRGTGRQPSTQKPAKESCDLQAIFCCTTRSPATSRCMRGNHKLWQGWSRMSRNKGMGMRHRLGEVVGARVGVRGNENPHRASATLVASQI